MRLTSEVWDPESDTTKYKCSKLIFQHRVCESLDDACMVRNRVLVGAKTMSLLKGLCECPSDHECVETGKAAKGATVGGLQQDIFQCVPQTDQSEEEQQEHDDGNDQEQLEEYRTTNRVNEQQKRK